jgi:hypothetical protein
MLLQQTARSHKLRATEQNHMLRAQVKRAVGHIMHACILY